MPLHTKLNYFNSWNSIIWFGRRGKKDRLGTDSVKLSDTGRARAWASQARPKFEALANPKQHNPPPPHPRRRARVNMLSRGPRILSGAPGCTAHICGLETSTGFNNYTLICFCFALLCCVLHSFVLIWVFFCLFCSAELCCFALFYFCFVFFVKLCCNLFCCAWLCCVLLCLALCFVCLTLLYFLLLWLVLLCFAFYFD